MTPRINPLGRFVGPSAGPFDEEGENTVPIYGTEEIALEAANTLDTTDLGPTGMSLAVWNGNNAPVWNFNFEITAGIDPTPDTKKLLKYAKRMHSWVWPYSHAGDKKMLPVIQCVIPSILVTDGVMRRVSTSLKGPWFVKGYDTFSSGGGLVQQPLSIVFTGEFVIIPGWGQDALSIAKVTQNFESKKVAESFYSF
jgi:hypothetical protein